MSTITTQRLRKAFTLLEVVTAVSITVFLALIAVPRYTELVDRQEFLDSALGVARCVQTAQSEAVAPVTQEGKRAQYVVAEITTPSAGGTGLSCNVAVWGDAPIPAITTTIQNVDRITSLLLPDASATALRIEGVTIDPTTMRSTNGRLRWYFDVRRRGVLSAVRYQDSAGIEVTTNQSGGLWTLVSTRRSNIEAVLRVPDTGVPITVCRNADCG